MRNHSSFAFALAAVIGATGCAADMTAEELESLEESEAGKADKAGKAGNEYFIYDNGIRCITAPCPTITVVSGAGKTERVTDIVMPDESRYVGRMGLVVKGKIKKGPNNAATLTVSKIVGDAPLYDAYFNNRVCFTAPCPSYTAATATGEEIDFASVNFEAAARSEEEESKLFQKMHDGSLIVRGYVARGEWMPHKSGNILYVTNVLESDTVRFERDSRPVDGDFSSVKLERAEDGKFAATHHIAFYNRLEGREVNETRDLGDGLSCEFGLEQIVCSRDDRPVDGLLVELKLVRNADGEYDATVRRAWFDRIGGQPAEETVDVAFGLRHL